jgi:hypothetical protein
VATYEYTNPARRLHNILSRLDRQWDTNRGAHGLAALRLVFDEPATSSVNGMNGHGVHAASSEFLIFVGDVSLLPWQVLEELRSIGARELEWAATPLEAIAGGINEFMLMGNGESARSWLSVAGLQALEGAATALDHSPKAHERRLSESTLEVIVRLTREARDVVSADNTLHAEMVSELLGLLLQVEMAVVQYDARGIEGFRIVLERAFAQSVWSTTKAPEGSAGWKKVMSILAGLGLLIGFAGDGITIKNELSPWAKERPPAEIVNCVPERPALGTGFRGELTPAQPSADD